MSVIQTRASVRSSADEEAPGRREAVAHHAVAESGLVARFQVPANVFALPEHEIHNGRDTPERASLHAGRMNDLGTKARHELEASGERPRFLEQQIDGSLRRATRANSGDATFEVQPIWDRRDFKGERRPPGVQPFAPRIISNPTEFHND